jgi:acetolactate synthase-1/2/3 large subunit
MRAADVLARRLAEAGCRYAFGMPGGEVLTLLDAFERAGIRFILCKHENNAGFMAEGVYHRTGAPGILLATIGPGIANGFNVVANAEQDRVPLIAVTGCLDAHEEQTYTHQIFNHRDAFSAVTKETFLLDAEAAEVIADKAVSIAMTPRRGPVLLDVPISVAARDVGEPKKVRRAPHAAVAPTTSTELDTARKHLRAATRPIIIAGLDILDEPGGAIAVRDFVLQHNIPLVTTYKAKGVLHEGHPLSLGGAGLSPIADTIILPQVKAADLIILAGYDPIEMRPGWCDPWDPEITPVIEFAHEANRHYVHQASMTFIGDVGRGLDALGRDIPMAQTWPDGEIAAAKAALKTAFEQGEEWGPTAIVETTRAVLPDHAVVTVDSGAHRILASQVFEARQPRTMLQSTGLCTMGCAIPLAVGAKLADPETPVVAFTGDGGLFMVLGELSTAAELRLAVPVVVFVDNQLALIEKKQRGMQYRNAGVDFQPLDIAAIGRALGGHGVTVRDRGALETALEQALSAETFTLLACEIAPSSYDDRI